MAPRASAPGRITVAAAGASVGSTGPAQGVYQRGARLRHRHRPLRLHAGPGAALPPSRSRLPVQLGGPRPPPARRRQPLQQPALPAGCPVADPQGAAPLRAVGGLPGAGPPGFPDGHRVLPRPASRRRHAVGGRAVPGLLHRAGPRPGPAGLRAQVHWLAAQRVRSGGLPRRPLHQRRPRRPGGGRLGPAHQLVAGALGPRGLAVGTAPACLRGRVGRRRALLPGPGRSLLEDPDGRLRGRPRAGPRRPVARRPLRGRAGRPPEALQGDAGLHGPGRAPGHACGPRQDIAVPRPPAGVPPPARSGQRRPGRAVPGRAPGRLGLRRRAGVRRSRRLGTVPSWPSRALLGPAAPRPPFPLGEPGGRLLPDAGQALLAGLRAVGLAAGDEVLVPAWHPGPAAAALTRAGLVARHHELGPRLEPDPGELEALLGPRVRALYLIHYLGFPQDAVGWLAWCRTRGLLLLEDASLALPGTLGDRPLGSFGDLAAFSLRHTLGLPAGALHLPQPAGPPPGDPAGGGRVRVARRLAGGDPMARRRANYRRLL